MKSLVFKSLLLSAALGGAVFALAGTAAANHVGAVIAVPDQATVGQPVEVQARLHAAADAPVAGTPVTFYMEASFGGVSGDVELGQAVTDENGVAALTYEPRVGSTHEIRIEYLPPGDSEPAVATKSISVGDSVDQLYRSKAGIDIPGLNVWLLMALVSTVWAILLSVALRVIAISRAGGVADPVPGSTGWPGHAADRRSESHSGASGVS